MDVRSLDSMKAMNEFDYKGKTVLIRLDINSPLDPETKKIMNTNRINMSIPTLQYLIEDKAKIAIIAHQGDTLDYQNLISMKEHAQILSEKLGVEVAYVDDVAGPAAIEAVKNLKESEIVLLGNLRYLTEEVSTFEDAVKLTAKEMVDTYLVRNLAPLMDYYINDAFAAAHRNAPSMVAFQELLPSAAGSLMVNEVSALTQVREDADKPLVFVLGGAKISDAFGMMRQVLENGTAEKILTSGIIGHVMLMAKGYDIGDKNRKLIEERSLDVFIEPAKEYLNKYPDKIVYPMDLAYQIDGVRQEIGIEDLPVDELTMDIGEKTIGEFKIYIESAGTIFANGPAGVYEDEIFENGTKEIWNTISKSKAYSVIGGGDTVNAAAKYIDLKDIDYVCTAGGAMVRFLSGVELPLLEAMKQSKDRE